MAIQEPTPCYNCGRITHVTDSGYINCFMPLPGDPPLKLALERPSWPRYFMDIADAVSTRATCPRRAVGAVIVKDKRILATGFNGSPPGLPHCTEDGCWIEDGHCVRVIHAEHNAVLQGSRYGIALEGAECYTNTLPCLGCAKTLVAVGISKVIFSSDYRADPHLMDLGIELEFLDG